MSDKELAAQLRGLGTHATHVAATRIDEQAAEITRLAPHVTLTLGRCR